MADSRREQDKRQQAEKDLEQANKKLDEAADLLEHNQRVIQDEPLIVTFGSVRPLTSSRSTCV